MAIYGGFSHQKLWFSIATLNYQRVTWMFMHAYTCYTAHVQYLSTYRRKTTGLPSPGMQLFVFMQPRKFLCSFATCRANVGYRLVSWASIVRFFSKKNGYPANGGGGPLLWEFILRSIFFRRSFIHLYTPFFG